MSYEEYNDLFLKAQKNKNAKYIAFVFDIKSSKLMDNLTRLNAQLKTFDTIDLMIEKLNKLEEKENRKILIDETPVQKIDNILNLKNNTFSFLNNPCVISGDSFAFYCYNNSIEIEQFKEIFLKAAKICKNTTKYHFSYGNFETLNYNESNEKYYIGYIVDKLSKEKSKEENIL